MSLIDNKVSLLVQGQLPEFIREDYQTFVRFIEAYYEFLENKQTGKNNDLYTRAKELVDIKDVDVSLDEFEQQFFDTFLELFPRDTLASKSLLIKNAIPFYLSKGNEKSFRYFFRALFNEEIDIEIPRNDVLIASGGNWKIIRVLRAQTSDIRSVYRISQNENITNKKFYLPFEVGVDDIQMSLRDPSDNFITDLTFAGESNIDYWNYSAGRTFYIDAPIGVVDDNGNYPDNPDTGYISSQAEIMGINIDVSGKYLYAASTNRFVNGMRLKKYMLNTPLSLFDVYTTVQDYDLSFLYTAYRRPYAVFISPDQKNAYFLQEQDDTGTTKILQYRFGVAGDLTTLTNTGKTLTLSIFIDTASFKTALAFSDDGTKIYVVDHLDEQHIKQYNLSTAWDLSTYTSSKTSVNSIEQIIDAGGGDISAPVQKYITSIRFRPDGKKMYVLTSSLIKRVFLEFELSVAWDISDLIYTSPQLFNVLGSELGDNCFTISSDGSTIFACTENGGDVASIPYSSKIIYQYRINNTTFATPGNVLLQKEYKKLSIDQNSIYNYINAYDSVYLNVTYNNFDSSILYNRKITGDYSGASALIESISNYNNFGTDIFEFEINPKTLEGEFLKGENFTTDVLDENEDPIVIKLKSASKLTKINLTDGGYSYNVGDAVSIYAGDPITPATAIISEIYAGVYNKIAVSYGGAGFTALAPIVTSNVYPYSMNAIVSVVDTSGGVSANTIKINNNLILDVSNVSINTANYKANSIFLSSALSLVNANSRMIDAFSYTTVTSVGPVSEVYVFDSNIPQANALTLNATGAKVSVSNTSGIFTTNAAIKTIGSIGRVDILTKGSGYSVGDKLVFTPIPGKTLGYGAAGAVAAVDSSGAITKVELQPFAYSSNANYSVSVVVNATDSSNVAGSNTNFQVDFKPGYQIMVFNQARIIKGITSNTSMNVTSPFTTTKLNTDIGLYDLYPIGGLGYSADGLPLVTVSSSTGVGATLVANCIMGSGDSLIASGTNRQGEIKTITIVSPGLGYKAAPIIDLTLKGSGTAKATAQIQDSYYSYDGKYVGTQGQLSGDKKIQDSAFYNTGSYVLKTKQQFSRFKSSLLKLLHPSGSVAYAQYTPEEKTIYPGGVNLISSTAKKTVSTPVLDLDFTLGTLNTSSTTSGSYNIYTTNTSSNTSIVTFTRSSNATYIGSDGYIKTAGINQPRFEYNAVTKQAKGLLLEVGSTNLISNSGNLAADSWTSRGIISKSTIPNAELGPDGTQSMTYFKVPSTARTLYANSFATATNIIFVQNQGIAPIILSEAAGNYAWNVSGQGIATGTYVVSANNSNNFILLSAATSAAGGNGTNDSSNTANTLTFTFSSVQAIYGADITLTANTTYTTSGFFKLKNPREISSVLFGLLNNASFDNGQFCYGIFDLANNTVTTVTTSGGSNTAATITDYGNQIYRLAVRVTTNTTPGAAATTTNYPGIQLLNGTNNRINPEASNLVGKGLYVWGIQVEQRDAPSSYIPTGTSSATRSSEGLDIGGSNFSNWFNPTEGTFEISTRINHVKRFSGIGYPLLISDITGGTTDFIGLRTAGANTGVVGETGRIDLIVRASTSVVIDGPSLISWGPSSSGINNAPIPLNLAVSYAANSYAYVAEGSSAYYNNSVSVLPSNLVRIYFIAQSESSITHSRLTYYPYRLSNNALQYITGNTTISL